MSSRIAPGSLGLCRIPSIGPSLLRGLRFLLRWGRTIAGELQRVRRKVVEDLGTEVPNGCLDFSVDLCYNGCRIL